MVKYYCVDMKVKKKSCFFVTILHMYIFIFIYNTVNVIHNSNLEVLFLARTLFTSVLLRVQKRIFKGNNEK